MTATVIVPIRRQYADLALGDATLRATLLRWRMWYPTSDLASRLAVAEPVLRAVSRAGGQFTKLWPKETRARASQTGGQVIQFPGVSTRGALRTPVQARATVVGRSNFRRKALLTGAAFLPVAVLAAPPVIGYVRLDTVRAKYAALQAQTIAVDVYSGDQSIGIMAQPGTTPTRMVIASNAIPNEMWQLFEGVEDTPHQYWGIPYLSILRAAVSRVLPFGSQGGSGAGWARQSSRAWAGRYGGEEEGKWSHFFEGLADTPSLSLLYTGEARKKFTLDALSFGHFEGFDLAGVTSASRVVFAKEPSQLGLEEMAILVASLKVRLPLRCSNESRPEDARSRERIRSRAIQAVAKAFGNTDTRAVKAIANLKTMAIPNGPALYPAALAAGLSPREACVVSGNLAARMGQLSGSEKIAIESELLRIRKASKQSITAIRLTLPGVTQQTNFKMSIQHALENMQHSGNFYLPLVVSKDSADGLFVSTSADGAITGFAATTRRVSLDAPQRTASLAKQVVALAMAKAQWPENSMLCDRAAEGIQNAGGSRGYTTSCGGHGPNMVSLSQAFQKSMNLPLLWAAERLGDERLREAASAAGFVIPQGVKASNALALGMAESTPGNILAFERALGEAANNRPALGARPFIIRSAMIGGRWITPERQSPLDLRPFFVTGQSVRLIATICPAPYYGGTLQALAPSDHDSSVWCGKTGTLSGDDAYKTIAKFAVGSTPSAAWFSTLSAPKDYLGDSHVSSILASKVTRDHALSYGASFSRAAPEHHR